MNSCPRYRVHVHVHRQPGLENYVREHMQLNEPYRNWIINSQSVTISRNAQLPVSTTCINYCPSYDQSARDEIQAACRLLSTLKRAALFLVKSHLIEKYPKTKQMIRLLYVGLVPLDGK